MGNNFERIQLDWNFKRSILTGIQSNRALFFNDKKRIWKNAVENFKEPFQNSCL